MKPFKAWIAVSAQGHPVPFLGFHFTRADLRLEHDRKFPADAERYGDQAFYKSGYQAVRVWIEPEPKP